MTLVHGYPGMHVEGTDLIHEQYFGPTKEGPGHAEQLLLPDATASANFS
jgi:hypothetical protein